MAKVKLNELVEPQSIGLPYVRGSISQNHVDNLAVTLADALAATGKMPFTEKFIVMKLSQPVKGEAEGKLVKAWEAGARYVTINGIHRVRAIRKLNDSTRPGKGNDIPEDALPILAIDVEIRDPMPASEIIITQLLSDLENGLPITIEARDDSVRALVKEHSVKQDRVAKLFRLSQASISRILAGKQSMKQLGLEKAGGRKKGGRKAAKKGKKAFEPLAYLDMMIEYGAIGLKHEPRIIAALTTEAKAKKLAGSLRKCADMVQGFAALAEKPLPEALPPTNGKAPVNGKAPEGHAKA